MDDIIEEAAVRNLNRQETADRLGVSVPTMVKRAAVVGIYWEPKNRGKDHPNCLPPQESKSWPGYGWRPVCGR